MNLQQIHASLLAQDKKALHYIYVKYGEYCIHKLITYRNCSEEEAEGLFIDAVLIFREKVLNDEIKKLTNTGYYLYKICENTYLAQLKSKRNNSKKQSDVQHLYYSTEHYNLDSDLERLKLQKAAKYAWSSLNEKCKDIIYFFYVDKLEMKKIAELMGFANSNVAKTAKGRCYKHLVKTAQQYYSTLKDDYVDQ